MGESERDQQDRDRIWNMVVECGAYERHFNQVQSFYRGLASTWLLATVGGIGYVLTKEQTSATTTVTKQPDVWNLAGWTGVTGIAGLFLLWVLDVLVYHRLLLGVFGEGRRLENQNRDWLPQVRSAMHAPAGKAINLF